MKIVLLSTVFTVLLLSCTTTHMDKDKKVPIPRGGQNAALFPAKPAGDNSSSVPEPEKEVVIIEVPVYTPAESAIAISGKEGVVKSLTEITKVPEYSNGRLKRYSYHPDFVYEIHCQPFHMSDVELMPGESAIEEPYISEPDVWQIAKGESYRDGKKVIHYFIKPDYSGLDSNMVLITDFHVYHLRLKSFSDYSMPIIRWTYPLDVTKEMEQKREEQRVERSGSGFEYYSFNYKIKKSAFLHVSWEPKQVYDDGRKTYIIIDEQALHQELPALYNEKKEIVNYRVDKNTLIVDGLIRKMTLRLGKQKITIQKK